MFRAILYSYVENPIQLNAGMIIDLDPQVSINVIASNSYVSGASATKYDPINKENAKSITLLISYNGFDYFIGGDLTKEVEERLVLETAVGDIDVYKVNHHGAATSSSLIFLETIQPEVAIISNGSYKNFNHPRKSVLVNLNKIEGIDIYQTNKLTKLVNSRSKKEVGGNVLDEFIADPETKDSDGNITIIIGEENYSVIMPARNFTKMYEIEKP